MNMNVDDINYKEDNKKSSDFIPSGIEAVRASRRSALLM
jgi:hypothetical protein